MPSRALVSCEGDYAIARANSLRVAPDARLARTNNSRETLGSPASSFATRDWLEPIRSAKATWLKRPRARAFLANSVKRSLISISAESSGVSSRNSATEPVLQPASFRRFLFPASITTPVNDGLRLRQFVVLSNSFFASFYNGFWCLPIFFCKDRPNHKSISVHSIDKAPCLGLVGNPQLMTPATNGRHWSRLRHA